MSKTELDGYSEVDIGKQVYTRCDYPQKAISIILREFIAVAKELQAEGHTIRLTGVGRIVSPKRIKAGTKHLVNRGPR